MILVVGKVVDPVVHQVVEVVQLHVPEVEVEDADPVVEVVDPAVVLTVDPMIKDRRCIFTLKLRTIVKL